MGDAAECLGLPTQKLWLRDEYQEGLLFNFIIVWRLVVGSICAHIYNWKLLSRQKISMETSFGIVSRESSLIVIKSLGSIWNRHINIFFFFHWFFVLILLSRQKDAKSFLVCTTLKQDLLLGRHSIINGDVFHNSWETDRFARVLRWEERSYNVSLSLFLFES